MDLTLEEYKHGGTQGHNIEKEGEVHTEEHRLEKRREGSW